MDVNRLTDEEMDREIRSVRSQRDFARLSVQLLEISLQRAQAMISNGLQGFEEQVREPEPNPNRFIGYVKYDKDAYVHAYEELKPMRDLVRLINTFLPNMRVIRDNHQSRFEALLGERDSRILRARMENALQIVPEPPVAPAEDPNEGEGANENADVARNNEFRPHPDGGIECEGYEY